MQFDENKIENKIAYTDKKLEEAKEEWASYVMNYIDSKYFFALSCISMRVSCIVLTFSHSNYRVDRMRPQGSIHAVLSQEMVYIVLNFSFLYLEFMHVFLLVRFRACFLF